MGARAEFAYRRQSIVQWLPGSHYGGWLLRDGDLMLGRQGRVGNDKMTRDVRNNRRGWFRSSAAWVVGLMLWVAMPAQGGDRPHIVLLMADSQGAGLTGFEGHGQVKTPHLDRLAAEGVWFARAYTPTPQWAPSRASILTGQYPHTHRVLNDDLPLPAVADTFTTRLEAAGYTCALVGQWHMKGVSTSQPAPGIEDHVAVCPEARSWDRCTVMVQGEPSQTETLLDDWTAQQALAFLDRAHEQPFFLWVNFRGPCEPTTYPPGTEELYPADQVELPPTMEVNPRRRSNILANSPPAKAYSTKNPSQLREDRSRQYARITHLDAAVGRVLERLDQPDLRDRTVVVFASDGGWPIGNHALWGRGPVFYEEVSHVPMVIRRPGDNRSTPKVERIVSLVDLAPTFLDLAGLIAPITMHGRSLLGLLDTPDRPDHADERFVVYDRLADQAAEVRGVVTPQFKLIDYIGGNDEFYDLGRDPHELHNAMTDLEYQAIIKVLQDRLQTWRQTTRDPRLKR